MGHGRGDRLEFAAHFSGCIRLEVQRVELAGAAAEEDDQDGFRAAGADRSVRCAPHSTRQTGGHDASGAGLNPSLPFGNTYGALPFSVLLGRDGRILDTRLGEVTEASLETWTAPHRGSTL